jgi:uncharacterized protein (TIGR03437 family)
MTECNRRFDISDLSPTWPKVKGLPWLLFLPIVFPAAFSQALPQIQPGGIVNAASYAQPIAPRSVVAIFGANLASAEATASGTPLPTELAGTSVTVNGTKAPLFFVSSSQINIQIPYSLETSYIGFTKATVVVTTPLGSSAPVDVPAYGSSPGLFTSDGGGCGQAAALNIGADGIISVNSRSNSAAPGDYMAMFGTGLTGTPTYPPIPDGTYPNGPLATAYRPGVSLGGNDLSPSYAGPAPLLVGVDQINFQIPQSAREGCAVPVSVDSRGLIGPTLSISIHSGRGECVDPPIQSYGQITLTKTTASGTNSGGTTETLMATFPSAPGLKAPQQDDPTLGAYTENVPVYTSVSRTCTEYPQLSAGAIGIAAAVTGQTITAQPIPVAEGVIYQQPVPNGFIQPGPYAISASGNPVAFEGSLSVGSPIQIQTTFVPGTSISQFQPLVIKWTGGDPGTLVKVSLISVLQAGGVDSVYDYGYKDAESGSFTFTPHCSGLPPEAGGNGVFCTFGIPPSGNATVVVEVAPAPSKVMQVSAQGVTGAVQISWVYRYVFGGLILD